MSNTLVSDKTFLPHSGSLQRKWHLLDARGQVLGRISSRIASLLVGKGKVIYTPTVDCGDFVIVVNVEKIALTGNKLDQKIAFHHTGHPGGARFEFYGQLMQEKPERALHLAVKRMLPKNKLASRQILRLKIYRGEKHPHQIQNPGKVDLK